jgi:hypothetical protein
VVFEEGIAAGFRKNLNRFAAWCIYSSEGSLQSAGAAYFAALEEERCDGLALCKLEVSIERQMLMTRTLDALTEAIRDPKPSFRQIDDRPEKAKKHRYERRKIREFIRLGDWAQENPA